MTPYKMPTNHNLQTIELSPFESFVNLSDFGLMKQQTRVTYTKV